MGSVCGVGGPTPAGPPSQHLRLHARRPPVLLVVSSATEGGLAEAFERLEAMAPLPELMARRGMEMGIPRIYLILHNARTSTPEQLERCARSFVTGTPHPWMPGALACGAPLAAGW